jgi:hypothetical protein
LAISSAEPPAKLKRRLPRLTGGGGSLSALRNVVDWQRVKERACVLVEHQQGLQPVDI